MKQCEIDRLIESKTSCKKQKGLIFGVGHFDVSFPRSIRINGRQHNHSAYSVWNSMLRRCYAQRTVKMARNYAGCSVCDEWLYFSNFLTFYKAWHRENYALDKDLLMPGNKVYSPERCVFVPQALNNFTLDRACARGDYPLGVCWDKQRGKFKANIRVNGKLQHIGLFDTAYGAHTAWHNKKMELAMQLKTVCDGLHPALYSGLILKVESMRKTS